MKSYLLDTNVLIGLFSRHTADRVRRVLQKLTRKSIFYLCGLVLSEFYQGIEKDKAEYYSALLEEFPYLHCNRTIYEHAGLRAYAMKKKGRTVPLGDCLIAQVAKYYKAEVVTLDKDFLVFPDIKVKFFKLK